MVAVGVLCTVVETSLSLFQLTSNPAEMELIVISGIGTTLFGGMIAILTMPKPRAAAETEDEPPLFMHAVPLLAGVAAAATTLWPLALPTQVMEQHGASSVTMGKAKSQAKTKVDPKSAGIRSVVEELALVDLENEEIIAIYEESLAALQNGEIKKAKMLLAKVDEMLMGKSDETDANLKTAALIKSVLADLNLEETEPDQALQQYEEALHITPADDAEGRAAIMGKIGSTLQKKGRIKEAEDMFRQAVGQVEEKFGPDSTQAVPVLRDWGQFYAETGQLDQAVDKLSDALLIEKESPTTDEITVAEIEAEIAAAKANQELLASQDDGTGDPGADQGAGQDTGESPPPVVDPTIPWVDEIFSQPAITDQTVSTASQVLESGNFVQAEEILTEYLAAAEVSTGQESLAVASSKHNLASALANQGKFDQAKELLNDAIRIKKLYLADSDPALINSFQNLSAIHRIQGDFTQAISYQSQALNIQKAQLGISDPRVAVSYNNLGRLHERNNDYNQAKYYYEQSLGILKNVPTPNNPYITTVLANYASALRQLNNPTAADYYLEQVKIIQSTAQ